MTAVSERIAQSDRSARSRALLGLAVLSAALFGAVYLVFVQTAWGQSLDDAALAGRGRQPPDVVHGVLDLLATIDLGSLLVAIAAIAALGYRRGRRRLAIVAGSVIVGSVVSAEALKRFLLTRPALLDSPDPFGTQNSLPSGHATVAMVIAMALVLVVPPPSRRRIAFIAGTYAIAIGGAAITAGWHRPSDVAAAYLLVTVWATVAAASILARSSAPVGQPRERPSANGSRGDLSVRGIVLLAATLVGLVAVLVVIGWPDLVRVQFTVAYVVGVGGPAALGFGLLVAWCRLLVHQGTPRFPGNLDAAAA